MIMKAWIAVVLFSSVVWCAHPAAAQGSGDREGKWEARLALLFQQSADADFDGGTTASIDSDTGFRIGVGHHLTDQIEFGFNFDLAQADYDADIVGDVNGVPFVAPVRGELDYTNASFDATFNFMTGQFSPFIVGAIGWSWVDTNIATEPPQTGCWWDPWWGYVCTTFQDTKTIDGFTYEVGLGARYDFNESFSLSGSYRKTWHDWDNADGAVDIDTAILSFGWKF
jgi:opacity protein-like surface antigen